MRYFEDAEVGDVFYSPTSYKITAEEIKSFAAQWDPQRTRLSEVLPEFARSYDPNVLRTLPKADAPPNAAMARTLYQRSLMLGVVGIDGELDRLGNEAAPVAR